MMVKELMDWIEDETEKEIKLGQYSCMDYIRALQDTKRKAKELAKKELEDETFKDSKGIFLTWLYGQKIYDELEEVVKQSGGEC